MVAGSFGTLTPNTSNVASGTLALAGSGGGTTNLTLATAYFTASGLGSTAVQFAPTTATSSTATNLLGAVRVGVVDVCVAPSVWGDANADGAVNIIDAQQIARYAVGLTVAFPGTVVAQGDVNGDLNINIIDAQQVARFSVGLSAAPRVNAAVAPVPTAATVAIASLLDGGNGGANPGIPANSSALSIGTQAIVRPRALDASSVDVTRMCADHIQLEQCGGCRGEQQWRDRRAFTGNDNNHRRQRRREHDPDGYGVSATGAERLGQWREWKLEPGIELEPGPRATRGRFGGDLRGGAHTR